jgi:sugar/nucleoside kinase (ribokinase family)
VSKKEPKVMVAGLTCLDITPGFPQGTETDFGKLFRPGKLILTDECKVSLGGPVPNTGIGLEKMGFNVLLSGKTGKDELSVCLRSILGEERSRCFSVDPSSSSSYTIVLALPGKDRIFVHHNGVNGTFGADDIDWNEVADVDLFHLGYPPGMKKLFSSDGAELREIMRKAKDMGATTSLDMSLPSPGSEAGELDWTTLLKNVLPYVDLYLPSIEETTYMLDRPLFEKRLKQAGDEDPVLFYEPADYERISGLCLEMGAAVVALKSGIRGFYIRTAGAERLQAMGRALPGHINEWANREMWAPSFKADPVVSATGSGDSSITGFLSAFLRGFRPEDAVQIANTVGWQNVRGMDALSTIEDWPATLAYAADKNRVRNPLDISAPGWNWSGNDHLFFGANDRK